MGDGEYDDGSGYDDQNGMPPFPLWLAVVVFLVFAAVIWFFSGSPG